MHKFLLNGIHNLQRNTIIQLHTSIFSSVQNSVLGTGSYLPGEQIHPYAVVTSVIAHALRRHTHTHILVHLSL